MTMSFSQERHVELVAGAAEAFVVTSLAVSASIPADVPHLNVFVMTVVDVTDPKQDVLARVAQIADLSTIPQGRDAGLDAPGPDGIQFLSATCVLSYGTLETALDGAQAVRDRVSALVVDWQNFRTNFNAPTPTPAIYVFPLVSVSQKAALIQTYKTAKQDRYQKQIDKTAADATLARANTDYTYKQGLVTGMDAAFAAAQTNQTEVAAMSAAYLALDNAGVTFLATAGCAAAPDKAAFQTALNVAAVQLATFAGYVTDAVTLSSIVAGYRSGRFSESGTAATTLATAQTDQTAKAQLVTSALATEAAALAAVIAVCPDFDLHSIPYVDG